MRPSKYEISEKQVLTHFGIHCINYLISNKSLKIFMFFGLIFPMDKN